MLPDEIATSSAASTDMVPPPPAIDINQAVEALIHCFSINFRPPQTRSAAINKSFRVGAEELVQLNEIAASQLYALPLLTGSSVKFSGHLDAKGSTLTYNDFNMMLREGFEADPHRLYLRWEILLNDPVATVAYIECRFMTDTYGSLWPFIDDEATINVDVGGPNTVWTKTAVDAFLPPLNSITLGGRYHGLLYLKNLHIFTMTALASWYIVRQYTLSPFIYSFIGSIPLVTPTNVADKNALAIAHLANLVVLDFSLSILLGLAVLFGLKWLIPRSGIVVGVFAKRRWDRTEDGFQWVVFHLLIGTILFSIVKGMMTAWIANR